MKVIVCIPAHNEAVFIGAAVLSARQQTSPPDEIYVIADNCTDDTARLARAAGAQVVETVGNTQKKTGALNQFFDDAHLVRLADDDIVLVQDADTQLSPEFLAIAAAGMKQGDVGAVGGVFYGQPGGGLLGQLQRNELYRYARLIDRAGGEAPDLTGQAVAFRAGALKHVQQARGSGELPDGTGTGVYVVSSLSEDTEITMALRTLGYRCLCPGGGCTGVTRNMPSLRKLARQRIRWQRGTLEEWHGYGQDDHVSGRALGVLKRLAVGLPLLALAAIPFAVMTSGIWLALLLAGLAVLAVTPRVMAVRCAGWKGMVTTALVVPELAYEVFQLVIFVWVRRHINIGTEAAW